jgi:signal transduction histidine kinase
MAGMTTAALPAAPPARRAATIRWQEWAPSVATAAVVGAFLLLTPQVVAYETQPGGVIATLPVGADRFTAVAGLCVVAGVVVGRRWPLWGTALTFLPFLQVPWNHGFVWGWWLGILAVAVLAALDGLARAVVPTVVALLVVVWYCGSSVAATLPIGPVTAGSPGGSGYQWVVLAIYAFWVVASVGIAAAAGSARRSRIRTADARATEQHALAVESLAGERARLARDLHDVVAHHVSLVAVRAESAPFVHPGLDEHARTLFAAIATDAREALAELRQVLVVLERTTDASERAPQPTACDVDDLVASAVAAGQPVALSGRWQDVPSAAGYVLFRAVQEGLTNARRHAPGVATALVLGQSPTDASFRMSNVASDDRHGDVEPARGLIGMRERVEALGGTMSAVVDDGRFVLEVALPLAEA